MRYRLLGRSGLRVSELCLGTMTFGEEWGWGSPKDDARAIFDAYAEAGGNFLDTANYYTGGTSERLLGAFMGAERDRFVLATKYTLTMRPGDPNAAGNSRKNMMRAVEASLERLGTDYIDLLWVHFWDGMTPVEEVMRGLDDLVRQGKVLYVGISDAPSWIVSQANTLAALRGWTPFVGLQIEYSLVERTVERELTPMAQAFGLSVLAWSPLGAGVLSGKYNDGFPAGEAVRLQATSRHFSERNLAIAREVASVASAVGASPSQVALAWLRQQPGQILPIIGARRLSQLHDNLGCTTLTLDADALARLDAVSAIEPAFPQTMLTPGVKNIVYSGAYDLIDR